MESQFTFQFGIEIELLIGSRSKTHKSWKSLASDVSNKLAKAGIPNHVNESADKSVERYQEWSIVQEVTIPMQAVKGLWGIELVSPVLNLTDLWAAHLTHLFKTLKNHFTLHPSNNTSTHIHLSTQPLLPTSLLAALSKSILYFEPALDAILPPNRQTSYWCQSNRANPALKHLSLPQAFQHLDYCVAVQDVVRVMNLYPANSAYGRANGYTEDFVHGVYKWDFSGLLDASSSGGTVEFRQCPGSRAADDVVTWVELAVAFVAGSIGGGGIGNTIDPERIVSIEDLWWLVSSACASIALEGRALERLFAQAGNSKKKAGRK